MVILKQLFVYTVTLLPPYIPRRAVNEGFFCFHVKCLVQRYELRFEW